jgi:hypothetical protein
MHFYGLDFEAMRRLPIRVFWVMSKQIERIRADEILAWMPAHSIAMGGDHVSKVYEQYKQVLGQPMVTEQYEMTTDDRRKLKKLFG